MGHFKSNLRDLQFNLFEVFKVDERLGCELDAETARDILRELERLATGPLSESYASSRPLPSSSSSHSSTRPSVTATAAWTVESMT